MTSPSSVSVIEEWEETRAFEPSSHPYQAENTAMRDPSWTSACGLNPASSLHQLWPVHTAQRLQTREDIAVPIV